jgi:hypothetical protein
MFQQRAFVLDGNLATGETRLVLRWESRRMNIIDMIATDPNVSPNFRAAIAPTKAQTAAWYQFQAALSEHERAELKRDKEDQDHRERLLGDAFAERMGGM